MAARSRLKRSEWFLFATPLLIALFYGVWHFGQHLLPAPEPIHWRPQFQVESIAFSPDGRLLATGDGGKTVTIWDIATQTALHTLRGHSSVVWGVDFTPDGRHVISGDEGVYGKNLPKLLMWEVNTGALVKSQALPRSWGIGAVRVAPDGKTVAVRSLWGSVRLYALPTLTLKREFAVPGQDFRTTDLRTLRFSPRGNYLAESTLAGDFLWHLPSGRLKQKWRFDAGDKSTIAISADEKYVARIGQGALIELWDLQAAQLLAKNDFPSWSGWTGLHFSRNGQILYAYNGASRDLHILEVPSLKLQRKIFGGIHAPYGGEVVFSSDEKHLAGTGIEVWQFRR